MPHGDSSESTPTRPCRDPRITARLAGTGTWAMQDHDPRDGHDLLLLFAPRRSLVNTGDGVPALLPAGHFTLRESAGVRRHGLGVVGRVLVVASPAPSTVAKPQTARSPIVGPDHGSTARLASRLLEGVAIEVARGVGSLEPSVAHHVLGLVAQCVGPRAANPGLDDYGRRAQEFIELHLGDAELSVDQIAAHLNVSVRTLHRSFEVVGVSVGDWIRTRRLERCRADLLDPAFADVPVSNVAGRWGLWNAAHFSRAFKEQFGASPSRFRQTHLARPQTRLVVA